MYSDIHFLHLLLKIYRSWDFCPLGTAAYSIEWRNKSLRYLKDQLEDNSVIVRSEHTAYNPSNPVKSHPILTGKWRPSRTAPTESRRSSLPLTLDKNWKTGLSSKHTLWQRGTIYENCRMLVTLATRVTPAIKAVLIFRFVWSLVAPAVYSLRP